MVRHFRLSLFPSKSSGNNRVSVTMWLINCSTYSLEAHDVDAPDAKAYCILSHTWGDDEVTFAEMKTSLQTAVTKKGFEKIRGICEIALELGCLYAWVDTCCINKESSAELTESINSMFYWYQKAERCIAYLSDLAPAPGSYHPTKEELGRCRWFTRGWTLQELIAPSIVVFYDQSWSPRGTKADLCNAIHAITGIDKDTLNWLGKLDDIPVARKMAWAADRESTRIEDVAYCLLGIFGISMPLIYGERDKAFIRLQEMIAQKTNDMSLFAWRDTHNDGTQAQYSGLFAKHPSYFGECATIERIHDPVLPSPSWVITNAGLELNTGLGWSDDILGHRLYLHCTYAGLGSDEIVDPLILSIWLRKTSSGYIRYKPDEVCLQAQSTTRFGYSTMVRIATSVSTRDITEAIRFYHPQSHLLNSAMSFRWDFFPAAEKEISCHRNYFPQHLWDQQQRCFFTSSHGGFVGVVEVQLSSAPGMGSAWIATCWVLCGLALTSNEETEWGQTEPGLQPWVMVTREVDGGNLEGLDGHKRPDLLDPFTLSTLGHKLRERFDVEPPISGDCILRYRDMGFIKVSASILSVSDQFHRGRTVDITIHKPAYDLRELE